MCLSISDFYDKKSLDVSSHPKCKGNSKLDSFYVKNIPQQIEGACKCIYCYFILVLTYIDFVFTKLYHYIYIFFIYRDCEVHVVAYVEHISNVNVGS